MPQAGDFGDVSRTFKTTGGERVSKVETSLGGTLYYSEERGQITQQQYSSLSSQRPEVQAFNQNEVEDIEAEDLSTRYQAEATKQIGDLPPGSIAREKTKQSNMFVGFLLQDDTPNDRVEAVQQYEQMLMRLRKADTEEEIKDIKDDYNIGGTP